MPRTTVMENKILVTGIDLSDALRIARVSLEAGKPSAFIAQDPSSDRQKEGTHTVTIEFPHRSGAETAAAFVRFIAEVVNEVSVTDLLKAPDSY
jgi:hypothetical protein